MSSLNERLDQLRLKVQEPAFLEGKGLSNEVNIRIFRYDAEEEMAVRHFTSQIITDQTMACHLIECNLYQIFLEICEDLDIMDSIVEMEAEDGSDFVLEQLHAAAGEDEFIAKMKEKVGETIRGRDAIILTGVGDVFPFMRVHKMLEAMQPYFAIPILVMYPGTFDGSALKLFDRLTPNSYYRAFNEL